MTFKSIEFLFSFYPKFKGERLALFEIKIYIRNLLEKSGSVNLNSRIASGEFKLQ